MIIDIDKTRIVSGMIHLHAEGVVHRDLAARNILLDDNFEAVIADYGLSRILSVDESAKTKS